MASDELVQNGQTVQSLQSALIHGLPRLQDIPGLLKVVIARGMWRERVVPQSGEVRPYTSFQQFVKDSPPEGLGADVETLQRLCRDDPEALDALDRETKGRQGERTDLLDNIQEVPLAAPTGTSQTAALRRLRKSREDLHKQVLAGEKTAHAAMIEAGFRRPTITVPLDPQAAARAVVRHFSAEQLREFVAAIGAALDEAGTTAAAA